MIYVRIYFAFVEAKDLIYYDIGRREQEVGRQIMIMSSGKIY